MFVTLDTFQLEISWLKEVAQLNISLMFVTPETFQFPISWLKAEASANTPLIFVTFKVTHEPTSWLNADAAENIDDKSVTLDKSGLSVAQSGTAPPPLLTAAAEFKLEQPAKALFIEVQCPVPHWFTESIFCLSPALLK